jgi:hypothetical protein
MATETTVRSHPNSLSIGSKSNEIVERKAAAPSSAKKVTATTTHGQYFSVLGVSLATP